MMRLGPDKGNNGAVIRWGQHLDNGIWLRGVHHRKLWWRWRFMRGYWDFGIIIFRFGT